MRSNLVRKSGGFAIMELLLVLVIIGVIAGVGVFVLKQKNRDKSAATGAAAVTTATTIDKNKEGTTAGIDQANDLEAQDEANISTGHEANEKQSASSTNTALSNISGAYNEDSL